MVSAPWKRRFRLLALYEKRGNKCRKRGCESVPQWGESGGSQYVSFRWYWCDEHVMKRIRMFGLRDLTIEQPEKTVNGKA